VSSIAAPRPFKLRRFSMASSKITMVNELNFEELVLAATGPVLVDFTAAWCGPCKAQSKILDQVADQAAGVVIGTVDVDECPDLAARFGVRGMPTLLLFQGGKETGRRLGLTSEQGIRALVGGTT
jgi:thioredoxin 1